MVKTVAPQKFLFLIDAILDRQQTSGNPSSGLFATFLGLIFAAKIITIHTLSFLRKKIWVYIQIRFRIAIIECYSRQ
jgi:hypothetical protein